MSVTIDVEEFLTKLAIRNVSRRGDEVDFSCPFPEHRHGDATPSARMNANTGAWFCHGCGRRGNAVTFLAEHHQVSVSTAQRWISKKWQPRPPTPEELLCEIDLLDPTLAPPEEKVEPVSIADFLYLKDVPVVDEYMRGRGFDTGVTAMAGLRAAIDPDRVVIPYYDIDDRLVGFKLRHVADHKPKYINYYFKAAQHLYLGHLARTVAPHHFIVLCEGEFNALAFWQQGIPAVGISGSRISGTQVVLMSRLAGTARDVFLVWDSDAAGIEGLSDAVDKLSKVIRPGRLYVAPPHDEDPNAMLVKGIDLHNTLISNAQSTLTHDLGDF